MTSKIEKFANGMHYFLVPDDTGISKLKPDRRILCTLNAQVTFHCSLMPKKEGSFFIYVNKKTLKKLNLANGDQITFELRKDNSEFQFDFPEELQEVLRTDADTHKVFDSLTQGNKRSLLYLVTNVKSTSKKIERSLKIAEKLKQGITSPKLILKK